MFAVPNNRQAEHEVQILHEYRITAAGMYVCMHNISNTNCFKCKYQLVSKTANYFIILIIYTL